ncbi:MAG: outer rane biosis protein [Phycisphaerales bacterium]|nr:outer rane biosis protein [Phycisphaerales bacterium]
MRFAMAGRKLGLGAAVAAFFVTASMGIAAPEGAKRGAGAVAHGGSAEWPQYRGPESDGSTAETVKPWSGELKVLWKIPVGDAFGSFAVAGGKAYLFAEHESEKEACFAYDAATGKQLWVTDVDRTIHEGSGGNGPRSTPTISGDRVYVLSTYLKLTCLNAADGAVVWSHDLQSEFKGQNNTDGIAAWGNAASPIVEGDRVIVAGGGSGETYLAFDKTDGKLLWKSGNDKITHASPTPATIHGQRQIVFFMQSGLVSIDPQSGKELWRQKFKFSVSTAASPVIGGDIVYCSAGYGVGAGAFRVEKSGEKWSTKVLWQTPKENQNHWTTALYHDGYLYGLYGFKEFKTEPLKCLDIKTGKPVWSKEGFGQGGLILAGGNILIQGDQGQLVLAEATPKGYHELAQAKPLSGKAWQMPVLAEGKIFTRTSDHGEAVCLEAK